MVLSVLKSLIRFYSPSKNYFRLFSRFIRFPCFHIFRSYKADNYNLELAISTDFSILLKRNQNLKLFSIDAKIIVSGTSNPTFLLDFTIRSIAGTETYPRFPGKIVEKRRQ